MIDTIHTSKAKKHIHPVTLNRDNTHLFRFPFTELIKDAQTHTFTHTHTHTHRYTYKIMVIIVGNEISNMQSHPVESC